MLICNHPHSFLRQTMLRAVVGMLIGAGTARGADASWYTVDGGGAMFTSGGAFELSGTIAQHDAGTMTGGSFQLTGGFWAGTPAGTSVPGDCDGDGDVDFDDYAGFPDGLSGPGVTYGPPACACFDFDGNGAIELLDFAMFQQAYLQ